MARKGAYRGKTLYSGGERKGNKWVQQADNNILMYRVCVCVLYKGSGIPELFIIFIIQRGN